MQQSNVSKTSLRNHKGDRWIPTNANDEKKATSVGGDREPPVRALIVDRDSMSSDLLANALNRERNCEAMIVQPIHLVQTLASIGAGMVVIAADLDSQSKTGFDLAREVNRAYPDTYIVILLNRTGQEDVVNAFRSGACAVFSRQQAMTEFLDCIEHAKRGMIWAGKQETDSLLEALRSIPSPSLIVSPQAPQLTARELQVVQHAATGRSNRSIAAELGLSEHTVKNYLFRAFDKLGVSNRVQLFFYLSLQGQTIRQTDSEMPKPKARIAR